MQHVPLIPDHTLESRQWPVTKLQPCPQLYCLPYQARGLSRTKASDTTKEKKKKDFFFGLFLLVILTKKENSVLHYYLR